MSLIVGAFVLYVVIFLLPRWFVGPCLDGERHEWGSPDAMSMLRGCVKCGQAE